jgi:TolB-like protein
VRITVQLIDTATDGHIWANATITSSTHLRRQDEITTAIVATFPAGWRRRSGTSWCA